MRLRVPGGMLVGAILGAVLVNLTTGQAYIWPQTRVVAQVLTGAYIGCLVTTEDLRHLPRVIRPYLAVMSTFLALNLAVGFFHLAGNRPGSAHFPVLCRSRRYDGHPAHRPGHGGGRLHGGGDAVRADGIRHGLSALHHCPGRPEDRGGPDGAGGGDQGTHSLEKKKWRMSACGSFFLPSLWRWQRASWASCPVCRRVPSVPL